MKEKIILHIDMNSYFASVEQQANPFLRGKAVAVCAYLSENGTIIASSKEAKAKGIKTGCRVRDARLLDPKVILVENEPAKYRSTTEKIFKILGEYTDRLEPYSIDEAFLDLTGWVRTTNPPNPLYQGGAVVSPLIKGVGGINGASNVGEITKSYVRRNTQFEQAAIMGEKIQTRIQSEIGEWLKCSIGISWTKFLAKYAGDSAPKGGTLVITSENLEDNLRGRALTDAWGINTRMEARLNALGINDLLELKHYDRDNIKRPLGRSGYYLWAGVNGEEITEIHSGSVSAKSIGHSYCLPKKTADRKYLLSIFYKLCEKTGRRLRTAEVEAKSISIGMSYIYEGGIFKSWVTPEPMFTTDEIFYQVEKFFNNLQNLFPARSLAVSVSRLTPMSNQMKLFEDNLAKKNLSKALDKINDKYGEYTVVNGRMFALEDVAKDRIGFRKIL